MNKSVCHISTVHQNRFDTRIFKRECVSLAEEGYQVTLMIADGKGNQIVDGVEIIDLGLQKSSRISRVFRSNQLLKGKLPMNGVGIYHFHDPELIPFFKRFKKKNPACKVVFDIHENFKDKISGGRDWLPSSLRGLVKQLFQRLEKSAQIHFDGFVGAVERIIEGYPKNKSIILRNFPDLKYFNDFQKAALKKEKGALVYTGGFTAHRGIEQIVDALDKVKHEIVLHVFGACEDHILERCKKKSAWQRVKYHGKVDQAEMFQKVHKSEIAFVLNQSEGGYQYALPNKLFEYMACTVPVICSEFPHWKEVVELNDAGICVDPGNTEKIADAINCLLSDKQAAIKMGENGRVAVTEHFNWEKEFRPLLDLYQSL
ncbi:MAG: glycosyltransferase family 4 protein [Bacteroidota bacterium]